MARNNNNNNNNLVQSQVSNHVQDQLDPYYVHPSENSSTVCVTPALSGDNNHAWSMNMRRALTMKNKFKFVDRSIEVPDKTDLNFAAL